MKTITFQMPDNLEVEDSQLAMILASQLYQQGKVSIGQAAQITGLTKRTFIELLGKYNVSIFNFPANNIASDVANA
jgi:predicted HTH domain antitoxin